MTKSLVEIKKFINKKRNGLVRSEIIYRALMSGKIQLGSQYNNLDLFYCKDQQEYMKLVDTHGLARGTLPFGLIEENKK